MSVVRRILPVSTVAGNELIEAGFQPTHILVDNMSNGDVSLYAGAVQSTPLGTTPFDFVPKGSEKMEYVASVGVMSYTIRWPASTTGGGYVKVTLTDDPEYRLTYHRETRISDSASDGGSSMTASVTIDGSSIIGDTMLVTVPPNQFIRLHSLSVGITGANLAAPLPFQLGTGRLASSFDFMYYAVNSNGLQRNFQRGIRLNSDPNNPAVFKLFFSAAGVAAGAGTTWQVQIEYSLGMK